MEVCIFCSNLLSGKATKYCSRQCQQDHSWLLRKCFFEENGFWDGVNSEIVIGRRCKRYLKDVRGEKCEICGFTSWMGKEIPLILDHIDGDASNSSVSNIRLVCGNCDMQLSTYKSKNRGKGRYYRRQRYKEGKSS